MHDPAAYEPLRLKCMEEFSTSCDNLSAPEEEYESLGIPKNECTISAASNESTLSNCLPFSIFITCFRMS